MRNRRAYTERALPEDDIEVHVEEEWGLFMFHLNCTAFIVLVWCVSSQATSRSSFVPKYELSTNICHFWEVRTLNILVHSEAYWLVTAYVLPLNYLIDNTTRALSLLHTLSCLSDFFCVWSVGRKYVVVQSVHHPTKWRVKLFYYLFSLGFSYMYILYTVLHIVVGNLYLTISVLFWSYKL